MAEAYVVSALLEELLNALCHDPWALVRFSSLKSNAFGKTWMKMSGNDPRTGPLKDIVRLLESATGMVLELGPGNGEQVTHMKSSRITSIYGIEPCEILHQPLRAKIIATGLAGKYHILNCGGQRESLVPALERAGLLSGRFEPVFDTIICSKVLCSIPEPQATVENLYSLLKPGGRILVCEHVKNRWREPKGSLLARIIQLLATIAGWTFVMGGCNLDRNTKDLLRAVAEKDGGWKADNLETLMEWGTLPWIIGDLLKK